MISKNKVKQITSLHLKKNRIESGLFIAEGEKIVSEIIASDYNIETIIISESQADNFSKENPNLEIENVNKINPTLYQIGVTGSKGLVVFNQSFHTEWRAYIYNSNEPISNFFQLFGYNKNFREIDKKNHVIVNGFANGWIIEDEDLRGKTIVLEFRPQRGFYLGLIVSYVTLAFLIFCISYDFIKRNRKKAKKLTINLKANL